MSEPSVAFLENTGGIRIAYRRREGRGPTVVFLPGYASDMDGAKAVALDEFADGRGLSVLRFDYAGTGLSDGEFADGTLDGWLDDALLMVDRLTEGPVVLVGSSMGGWIALHLALRRPDRVMALVSIAAAPDFTDWGYTADEMTTLERVGRLEQPNPYGAEPQLTTNGFWQAGQAMLLLQDEIAIDCPVRLVHGDADRDVPLEVAFRLKDKLRSADVQVTVIKGGGHRLSEAHEIRTILRTVSSLVEPNQ
jgi:pimeloyl-ACP methyl ester carboxylesterase